MQTETNEMRTLASKCREINIDGLIAISSILNNIFEHWYVSGETLLCIYRFGKIFPSHGLLEIAVFTEEVRCKEDELIDRLIDKGFNIISRDSSLENYNIVANGFGNTFAIKGLYLNKRGYRGNISIEVPSSFFEQPVHIYVRNYAIPVPHPIEEYLEFLYGDWKNITPDNANIVKNCSPIALAKVFRTKILKFFNLAWDIARPISVIEFPSINKSAVDRFKSWDKDLGWCNVPNTTKLDKTDRSAKATGVNDGMAIFSTDGRGSRKCAYPEAEEDISFYGDSYCMCREVYDNETFEHYLGEIRETRVANYGVGNYGLDQALLRLQRDYPGERSKTVVLAVTSHTMARCCSVYRHYMEPGNVFAIKPRFEIIGDNRRLKRVDYPFKNKYDLLDLSQHKEFFRKHDEHFDYWKTWKRFYWYYYLYQFPRIVTNRLGISSDKQNLRDILNGLSYRQGFKQCIKPPLPHYRALGYHLSFWKSHQELFTRLMGMFEDLSRKHGFNPVFFLQHSKNALVFSRRGIYPSLPWVPAMENAAIKYPRITFIDEVKIFESIDEIDQLYKGEHHSPYANRMIAEYLDKEI